VTENKTYLFKKVPAVDKLLNTRRISELLEIYPRDMVTNAIRQTLEQLRYQIKDESLTTETQLKTETVIDLVEKKLVRITRPSLISVINATGVIIHTNLGRSPLAETVLEKLGSLPGGYCNLEYDINSGKRGSRYVHVEGLLKDLTNSEAAMVVNNNAAAVLLCLETIAKGQKVIVSRGQLVEIGGSFRIPDVMRKSGAQMVEVGTTNKTHLADYERAIDSDTSLLLKVHKSNFALIGFTEDVSLSEMVSLGRRYGIPVMEDLGSGCLINFSDYGLPMEPTVQDALAQGADLVTFSGDKLLGGPQAGIILGREDLIKSIRENQLTRALRIDKLTLLALEEALRLYMDKQKAAKKIPVLKMIFQSYDSLKEKAAYLAKLVTDINTDNFSLELMDGNSMTGGGSLPHLRLPSKMLCLVPNRLSAQHMETWLREYDPPIITRVKGEKVLFDVRTIGDKELMTVARAIKDLALIKGEMRGTDNKKYT